MGSSDVTVIEFKLAKNSNLKHVFEQVKIYDKANNTNNDIIVIFYFSYKEYNKTLTEIKNANKEELINQNIYLIDCQIKESASKSTAKS